MKDELISIIIPVFNKEKFIKKCLDSIVNQTYKNIEIVIINDGSTDNSISYIKDFKDSRIKLFTIKNSGVSFARNYGINKAKGKYIIFIDADDYIDENLLTRLYQVVNEHDVDIVRYNGYVQNKNKKFRKIAFPVNNKTIFSINNKEQILDLILGTSNSLRCYTPLLFLKKDRIIKFKNDVRYLEDRIFYLENFLNNKKILFLDECYYYYVFDNKSITKNYEKLIDNLYEILKSKKYVIDIARKNGYTKIDSIDESYKKLLLYKAIEYIGGCGNFINAKKSMKKLKEDEVFCEIKDIKRSNLNKFKRIQLFLLKNNFYFFEYLSIKIKDYL